MNVVMFAPEDLHLVKGNPQVRRRFIDMEIGQVSAVYLHEMSQYQKILQQRNHYLKLLQTRKQNDQAILEILTEQFIGIAVRIIKKRFEFLQLLQNWAMPIHKGISRGLETLKIEYKPSVEVSEDQDLSKMIKVFEDKFLKVKNREIERGVSQFGPHRDDLLFCKWQGCTNIWFARTAADNSPVCEIGRNRAHSFGDWRISNLAVG